MWTLSNNADMSGRVQDLYNVNLQVFDLTKGGPGPAIQMFKHVPDVRLLACGGDGTAGWVLSVLDKVRHSANTDINTQRVQ